MYVLKISNKGNVAQAKANKKSNLVTTQQPRYAQRITTYKENNGNRLKQRK